MKLTLKRPSKICSRQQSEIFILYFSEKTNLDISCESSAWQTIHMKCQDLFSSENKKKSKLLFALVMIGALRVNSKVFFYSLWTSFFTVCGLLFFFTVCGLLFFLQFVDFFFYSLWTWFREAARVDIKVNAMVYVSTQTNKLTKGNLHNNEWELSSLFSSVMSEVKLTVKFHNL